MLVDVTVLIPCRDGETKLPQTLQSILKQNVDTCVVVADDASVDGTQRIISDFGVQSVRYPKRKPRDYNRVAVLINMAYQVAPRASYYMISGDDHIFPHDYLARLIEYMERDGVDLASGYDSWFTASKAPRGSGRVMSSSMMKVLMPLPNNLTWDSWMLFRMKQLHKKYKTYPIETTLIGKQRKLIYTYGYASHLLGFPLVFTLGRMLKGLVIDRSIVQILSILVGQLNYSFRGIPKMEISHFIRELSKQRIKRKILSIMGVK